MLAKDPRAIGSNLKFVHFENRDPRKTLWYWPEVGENFGITRPAGSEQQGQQSETKLELGFILGAEVQKHRSRVVNLPGQPELDRVTTLAEAREHLKREDKSWSSTFDQGPFRSIQNPESPEMRERAPMQAFGFWPPQAVWRPSIQWAGT